MHNIAELVRRKALVAAAAAFIVGVILIVRSLAVVLAAPAAEVAGEPAVLEAPVDVGEPPLDELAAPEDRAAGELVVYVSGAVQAPDVYRLPEGARVKDLVLAAGGLATDADIERVNLAAPLADGQHVSVPRLGAVGAEAAGAEGVGAGDAGADELVNINTAGPAELDALPGIGPALAERIIAHREANGPFQAVEDLRAVKGIGASLFARIAPLVTV
ncbi:MAG TPA: ComEA family DNA-binding protein [Roseiflexaceae bacterium]|nr:ComEA family DNA-binding protein [Roseiflexaceae bacterium]